MTSDLWKKDNYMANIDYLFGATISEYDISKANISILRDSGLLDENKYLELYNMPKLEREKAIGNWQKECPFVIETITNGIASARKIFIESNNLNDYDILCIKKDSITVINKYISNTKISDHVIFRLDAQYNAFCKLLKKEIYYAYNRITQKENIRVKGIRPERLVLHSEYLLDFICAMFNSCLTDKSGKCLELLNSFYIKYIKREWEIGYYRRFDAFSLFDINDISEYGKFQSDFVSEDQKEFIDISYNENIIRQLQKIFSSYYFLQTKYKG